MGLELHESTEEREGEHLLVGVEGVGAADGIPLRLASKVWSALKTKVVLPFLKPKRVRFSSSLASSTPAAATPPAWARKFWLSKTVLTPV